MQRLFFACFQELAVYIQPIKDKWKREVMKWKVAVTHRLNVWVGVKVGVTGLEQISLRPVTSYH